MAKGGNLCLPVALGADQQKVGTVLTSADCAVGLAERHSMFLIPHWSIPLSSWVSVFIISWCFTLKTILEATVDFKGSTKAQNSFLNEILPDLYGMPVF